MHSASWARAITPMSIAASAMLAVPVMTQPEASRLPETRWLSCPAMGAMNTLVRAWAAPAAKAKALSKANCERRPKPTHSRDSHEKKDRSPNPQEKGPFNPFNIFRCYRDTAEPDEGDCQGYRSSSCVRACRRPVPEEDPREHRHRGEAYRTQRRRQGWSDGQIRGPVEGGSDAEGGGEARDPERQFNQVPEQGRIHFQLIDRTLLRDRRCREDKTCQDSCECAEYMAYLKPPARAGACRGRFFHLPEGPWTHSSLRRQHR